MKKYKVTAKPLIGDYHAKEYTVEAENEKSAHEIALNRLIKEEGDDGLLDSPSYQLVLEEVGYFYEHEFRPRTITDLIDHLEDYVAEMRKTEDSETIPKFLKQYAWEYFREVTITKDDLKKLAIFVVDKTYRIAANLRLMDKYTKAFFALVIPYLWDAIQNRGVDIFYIVDNTFNEDGRFEAIVELFQLSGMAVVTPYNDDGNREYIEVEQQIRGFMSPIRMIMYIEKDASVNYLDQVSKIAKDSKYLTILRNKASSESLVEVFDK